jgi:hypothetical protein
MPQPLPNPLAARCTAPDHIASGWTNIDQPVGAPHHGYVMLNDEGCCPKDFQPLQRRERCGSLSAGVQTLGKARPA